MSFYRNHKIQPLAESHIDKENIFWSLYVRGPPKGTAQWGLILSDEGRGGQFRVEGRGDMFGTSEKRHKNGCGVEERAWSQESVNPISALPLPLADYVT